MASVITHGLAAVIIGKGFVREKKPPLFWASLIGCSLLPDLDVIGFRLGVEYGDFWGHRGFTHSLAFALLVGFAAGLACHRLIPASPGRWRLVALFATVTASHGIFDALTNGGLGIAFFAPFDNGRYFFPWTPVEVTRVGFLHFVSAKGLSILATEVIYILAPLLASVLLLRRIARRYRDPGDQRGA